MSGSASICLVLAHSTLDECLRALRPWRDRVDIAELRVDHLLPEEAAAAARFPGLTGLPAILTVRRTVDGGRYAGPETDRAALLTRLLAGGFTYVDLEEDLQAPGVDRAARAAGTRIVRSLHDTRGVPAGLAARVRSMARGPDEIVKAAVTPRSARELAEVLDACEPRGSSLRVVLGMGDIGFATRVLAGRLGSAWCYASPTEEAVAPGHVTPRTLEETYRFRSVGPSTALYGVVGNPVMHSKSPWIHNRAFDETGLDAVYVPLQVPDIDSLWGIADRLEVRGLSVTVPHKKAVLGSHVRPDESVRAVGACNTLVRASGQGAWTGLNTDVPGFLAPLSAALGGSIPAGLRATVIGAGGAARSVVYGLRGAGAKVLVLNRTPEAGRTLTTDLGGESAGLDQEGIRAGEAADLIVQTTSVGMRPHDADDPVPGLRFTGRELVYELVYAPAQTPFVRRALAAGCRVVYGRQMLLAQAALQFQAFTGVPYPPALLEELERGFY
ncbi:MAG TPA: type I 3-dehydroquinate dehydratase [Spirochaetia bacterium]|nr:type I 3-dehydroquinate dehydratase [Spirochaetia bacterium]